MSGLVTPRAAPFKAGYLRPAFHVAVPGPGQLEVAYWQVEEEYPAPACVSCDEAAERRADHECRQRGSSHVGKSLGERFLGCGAQDDAPAGGDYHGSSDALENAHRMNWRSVVDMPQSTEVKVKMPMAVAKTEREPKRSATQPLMGMNSASVSM